MVDEILKKKVTQWMKSWKKKKKKKRGYQMGETLQNKRLHN
jgi:hypothetical protein